LKAMRVKATWVNVQMGECSGYLTKCMNINK
jgi:hypothetical protein